MPLHPVFDAMTYPAPDVVQVEDGHGQEVLETYLAVEVEKLELGQAQRETLGRIERLFLHLSGKVDRLAAQQEQLIAVIAGPVPRKK